jgi:inner membrane protein
MATVMTHAFVGASIVIAAQKSIPRSTLPALAFYSAIAAMLPDADVIAMLAGIPYEAPLGHRGFSHSLTFAVAMAIPFAVLLGKRNRSLKPATPYPLKLVALLFFASIASHPLLDMLTDGGLGSAVFAPFSWDRFFFPITPIPVSPIGLRREVLGVFAWEIALVWPAAVGLIFCGMLKTNVLKYSAILAAVISTVIALWYRNQYFAFFG